VYLRKNKKRTEFADGVRYWSSQGELQYANWLGSVVLEPRVWGNETGECYP
jgi:hypothetical protein